MTNIWRFVAIVVLATWMTAEESITEYTTATTTESTTEPTKPATTTTAGTTGLVKTNALFWSSLLSIAMMLTN
ncbi:unnamed protein product [Fasciola hepatica]|uniref:MEG-14 n=1 Tax=Fasciola hepatica TaxID=6192 RepID=A0ABC9HEU8_FASHE|nr:unnamed protein product [Fasciola hepatica]